MADAKIVDIKGVQWNLKDQEARNSIVEINTTLENQQTKIDELSKNLYINKVVADISLAPQPFWVKVENLYGDEFFMNNVFALTSRNGEYHELFCGLTDNLTKIEPIWISYLRPTGKISRIRYKNGSIWILMARYSALRVQQIVGKPTNIVISRENPPDDAIEIEVKQVTLS